MTSMHTLLGKSFFTPPSYSDDDSKMEYSIDETIPDDEQLQTSDNKNGENIEDGLNIKEEKVEHDPKKEVRGNEKKNSLSMYFHNDTPTLQNIHDNYFNLVSYLETVTNPEDRFDILSFVCPQFDKLIPIFSSTESSKIVKDIAAAKRIIDGINIPCPIENPDKYISMIEGENNLTLKAANMIKKSLSMNPENYKSLHILSKLSGKMLRLFHLFLSGEEIISLDKIEHFIGDIFDKVDNRYVSHHKIPSFKTKELLVHAMNEEKLYIMPEKSNCLRMHTSDTGVKFINPSNTKGKYILGFDLPGNWGHSVLDVFVEVENNGTSLVVKSIKILDVLIFDGKSKAHKLLEERLSLFPRKDWIYKYETTTQISPENYYKTEAPYFETKLIKPVDGGMYLKFVGISFTETKGKITFSKMYAALDTNEKLIVVGVVEKKNDKRSTYLKKYNGMLMNYDPMIVSLGITDKIDYLFKPEYMETCYLSAKKICQVEGKMKLTSITESKEKLKNDTPITHVMDLVDIMQDRKNTSAKSTKRKRVD